MPALVPAQHLAWSPETGDCQPRRSCPPPSPAFKVPGSPGSRDRTAEQSWTRGPSFAGAAHRCSTKARHVERKECVAMRIFPTDRISTASGPSTGKSAGSRTNFLMIRSAQGRIARVLATAVLATGIVTTAAVTSSPADASALLTNISVTVTTGMCPQGGSVHRVNVSISTPGTAGSNWSGDTVGGLQAFYGPDQIIGSNFCQTTWWGAGYYWYWSASRYFSFSGQHTYV